MKKPSQKLKVMKFKNNQTKTLQRLYPENMSTIEDDKIPGIDHFSKVTGGGMYQFYRLYDKVNAKIPRSSVLPLPHSNPNSLGREKPKFVKLKNVQLGSIQEKKFLTTNKWEPTYTGVHTLPSISSKYETLRNHNPSWLTYLGTPKYGNLDTQPDRLEFPYGGFIYSLANEEELKRNPSATVRVLRHKIKEYGNLFSFVAYGKYDFPVTPRRLGESMWYPDVNDPDIKHFRTSGFKTDFTYANFQNIINKYLSDNRPDGLIPLERINELAVRLSETTYSHIFEFAFCLKFDDPIDPNDSVDKSQYQQAPTVDEYVVSPLLKQRFKELDFSIYSGREGVNTPTYNGIYVLYRIPVTLYVQPAK